MAKLAAMGAYLYQALLAFGLLLLLARLLSPEDYVAYSLFVSIAQFGAIACFEWIRFACTRFYPGPDARSEATERGVIVLEFLASSALCGLGAAIAWGFGLPGWVCLAGLAAAVLQGGGELHLTMLRFRQAFRLFSWLQASRASIIACASLAAAAISPDFAHVVAGLLVGNLAFCLLAMVAGRGTLSLSPRWNGAAMRRHLAYGSVSAGAATASMLAPLGLKAIFTAALGASGAAAPILALDLLQRPFVLIVSAIQAIRYPMLVERFDRDGDSAGLRAELGRYYALLAGFAAMGAAGIVGLLALATHLVIVPELREAFLRTAPLVMTIALLRALIQAWLPTPAHLRRRLLAIALLAAADCLLMCAGAYAAARIWPGSDVAIAAGAAAGAALAGLGGLALLRLLPFEMPWLPIAASLTALAGAWSLSAALAGDLWLSTSAALAVTLLASLPVLPRMLRWLVR